MSGNSIRTATVIGAGTIGLGWTTLFLANGIRVRVNDPRPDLEQAVHEALKLLAPTLPGDPVDPAELATRLELVPDLDHAVEGVDVVQENGPEKIAFKQDLFARIERSAPADALLLSSTSALLPDDIGEMMTGKGRVIVGHPYNSPHVIPLVEILAGTDTAPETTKRAVDFYRGIGKTPVVLHKPVPGFVGNRIQGAVWREAFSLVLDGVVTPEELDTVVTNSLGLRWAADGPFQSLHLTGGPGGTRHALEMFPGDLTQGEIDSLVAQAETAFGGRSYEELAADRDHKQNAILAALASERK